MPDITRPDGAIIHYETFGSRAGRAADRAGGREQRDRHVGPGRHRPDRGELASEFTLIGMDQRHAGQSWNAPPHFSYDLAWQDQLAVLDDAGVERAQVWGGCIGVGYLLRLIQEAPETDQRGGGAGSGRPGPHELARHLPSHVRLHAATRARARAGGRSRRGHQGPAVRTGQRGRPLRAADRGRPGLPRHDRRDVAGAIHRADRGVRLGDLARPAAVLHGAGGVAASLPPRRC